MYPPPWYVQVDASRAALVSLASSGPDTDMSLLQAAVDQARVMGINSEDEAMNTATGVLLDARKVRRLPHYYPSYYYYHYHPTTTTFIPTFILSYLYYTSHLSTTLAPTIPAIIHPLLTLLLDPR